MIFCKILNLRKALKQVILNILRHLFNNKMAELDRLTPVLIPLAVYPVVATIIFTFVAAPKALLAKDKVKEYYDFYGKHVSMVHSIVSLSL